jgi:cobalt-zinc-cadmium efflux system outer membrane protein
MKTLLLISIAFTFTLRAADGPGTNDSALTLEQAFTLAERHHPDLAEARGLLDVAEGRARQAGAFPNPEAIARIESAPLRGRTTGDAEYLAGVSQTVPLSPRLSKAKQAERLERDKQAHAMELRRRDVRKRVHAAFATALYQERAFTAQSNITHSFSTAAQITRRRVDAGDALPEDAARVELELARAQLELDRAQSMRQLARRTLAAAIGAPISAHARPEGSLDDTFEVPALEQISAALKDHPALLTASADVRASEARVALAKAQRIPDVTVEALYRRLGAERRDAFDVGVSIPLPLFDRPRVREARGELAAAEARAQSTRNDLELRSHEAHAKLTTSLARTRSLRDDILPRAKTIFRTAETRYAAGDIRLADLLPIRRDWAAIQLTYLESLRDLAQAWSDVRSLIASPP